MVVDEKSRQEYKEMQQQRDRAGKDVLQVRAIKDGDGNVLINEESVLRKWREYFEKLMNEENKKEKRVDDVEMVKQEVDRISKEEVREEIKRMESGKSVGPDDITVEAWRCLGEMATEFLTRLFNKNLEGERMPEEWRRSVLVLIFKHKGDVQTCSNYRGIKLISHTMKLWERVMDARLREEVTICEQQESVRQGAKRGVVVLYEKVRCGGEVRVVRDTYEDSVTLGTTDWFKVEVRLHEGSALSPFLFAMVMDRLTDEVRQESL
ncbi:hypothetical protein C0J45_7752 [Silurus meridionalis]|nr:hypothetical protein C0J45_7752 [Silurus meridionalis]